MRNYNEAIMYTQSSIKSMKNIISGLEDKYEIENFDTKKTIQFSYVEKNFSLACRQF